jgi:hypothetical protein
MMDEIVKAAMAKWPDVPAVYGWLELTARGEWRIKGEPIDNEAIRDFIGRNYTNDGCGRWFFQNGPQRVYVSVAATPIVYRLDESGHLQGHTGAHAQELRAAFADAAGRLYLETELGPGVVDSQDMPRFAERIVDREGRVLDESLLANWIVGESDAFLDPDGLRVRHDVLLRIRRVDGDRLPKTFGFVAQPRAGDPTS